MNGQRPPQPETMVIECSAQNAIRTSDSFDEWEVAIPPLQLQQGDEIGVNQSFLEARGTATEILEFSSSGLNQNNKQRIMFEYYASDDGTNDKNKGRDWTYWGTGDGLASNPALHETGKTYLPCKAIRYDHLLEESLINANGNELKRTIEGQIYQTALPTDIDPRVANAFSINYKEDILVSGLFNSVNSAKEVRRQFLQNSTPYVGDINTDGLSNQDRLLTFTDNIVNLDGLDYWEMTNHIEDVQLKTPFMTAGTNYMASFPIGTSIWINWCPKRRQMSVYDGASLNADIPYDNYQEYIGISSRVGDLCGHFVIVDNNEQGVFEDSGHDDSGNPIEFGFRGKKCIITTFSKITSSGKPNFACPKLSGVDTSFRLQENQTIAQRIYVNPFTTKSKVNLKGVPGQPNLLKSDPCPINLLIRKSPLYIGSNNINQVSLPAGLELAPMYCPDVGCFSLDETQDPGINELFPKNITGPENDIPLYLGVYHKENLKYGESTQHHFKDNDSKLPFNQLGLNHASSPVSIVDYWTSNIYKPWGHQGSIVLKTALTSSATTIEMTCITPTTEFLRLVTAEGNTISVGRDGNREEIIVLGKLLSLTNDAGAVVANPTKMTFEIRARNIGANMISIGTVPVNQLPNGGEFDPDNPILWCDPTQYTPNTAPYDDVVVGSWCEWWDFREAKTLTVELDIDFATNFPKGLPITKNTGYWGDNEPVENYQNFPDTITDENYYTRDLKDIYNNGYTYFLYINRMIGASNLPFNVYEDPTGADFLLGGKSGFNRGCWMMPLTQSLFGNSEDSVVSFGVKENPTLTQQVCNSSDSLNASTTANAWNGQFNPHIPVWNMNFDFEINLSKIDDDGGGVRERNFYIWTPDIIEFKGSSVGSIHYKWSNQGLYYYLGWMPLCNQIEIETSKDYLTPTDLSNFWTETLHKSTNIKNLYDGNEIAKSKNRGILQNPLLMPIYGSWGYYNYPTKEGLLNRDYFTFPQTNGYAIGSVCFIDGHEMPTDITWTGTNSTNHEATRYKTSYIWPRSPNNIIHLFQDTTAFPMPTYTDVRKKNFDNGLIGTYQNYPTRNYLWKKENPVGTLTTDLYPDAPSGRSNNSFLSNELPGGTDDVSDANLSYTAPATNQKGEPAYSSTPKDKFDLFTTAADTDYPFTGTATQREDAIYRETQMYPIKYYSDSFYDNYLKFSQYIGCDNMTLTYNQNVSAFEFQFLHQPFATSFSTSGSGGDNAVRIFDNIPAQVGNWERYSGINVRNWASPIITRGQFTYDEIQNRPEFLEVKYPNGINPETDLDLIGDRFMNKLGFLKSQYDPRTGNMVKGDDGFGLTPKYPDLYAYEPVGTTGADTDVADAIINTSISAEDNPNSMAHNGLGQLIFYPSSQDSNTNNIRHTGNPGASAVPDGVRYDFSYSSFGQRGGLKTANHNKAMGYPNVVGTPQVEDVLTFPRTLNPDGEQRSGYTIEIGSSPLRALTLPIKLTDGYYYILCPDLIDDPQFYITANNGSVIPAIAIVSKTYVSGDFYTTFQSPIRFYCKRAKVLTKIKVQIRNSSMGVPSNLGSNSSVIFSINRFTPTITMPPLDTTSQQTLDYSVMKTKQTIQKASVQKTINDMNQLATAVIQPQADEADYIGGLQARINQHDLPNMDAQQRAEFFRTPVGQHLANEIGSVSQLSDALQQEETPQVNPLVLQQQLSSDRLLEAIRISARASIEGIGGMSVASDKGTATTNPLGENFSGNPLAREVREGMFAGGTTKEELDDPDYFGVRNVLYKETKGELKKLKDGSKRRINIQRPVKTKQGDTIASGGVLKKIAGPGYTKAGQSVFFTKPVRRVQSAGDIPEPKIEFGKYFMREGGKAGPLGSQVVGSKEPTEQTAQQRAQEEANRIPWRP